MELGVIGLPRSGKTTVFNALTRGSAQAVGTVDRPNLGVVKVPDPRLEQLRDIFKPHRLVPAEVRYVDIPGPPEGLGRAQGIAGQALNLLERTDALLLVVRAFSDPTVSHPLGSIDPHRDLATMQLELAFADLGILERRAERIQAGLKGAKPPQRDALQQEQALIQRLKQALEAETPIRELELAPEEAGTLENYQFLTAKPLLVMWNIDEEALAGAAALDEELRDRYGRPGVRVAALCGKLEMELAQMSAEEEREFRESLGTGESGLDRMIALCQEVTGLITFFTTVSEEVRAWTVPLATAAVKAAGKIHSDMERGFIRAEVVHSQDLERCGSVAEARRQGVLHLEGKAYQVQDGDIITFLFNI